MTNKLAKIKKTLSMLLWLNLFGTGAMLSSTFVWGLFQAIQETQGHATIETFILAAFGIITFAGTLYCAFKAFYLFATNQKSDYESDEW